MTEHDPQNKSPHDLGSHLDAGKYRPGLVIMDMPRAIKAVSEVATYGATKYTDRGWQTVPDGERRYSESMLRHLLAESAGEKIDPSSNLLHAAHLAWNTLARLELMLAEVDKIIERQS